MALWLLFDERLFVILSYFRPHDLLPDDTVVIYEQSGKAVDEIDFDDPDDEFVSDIRDRKRYIDLALTHYNKKNVSGTSQSYSPPTLISSSHCSFFFWGWGRG